MSGGNTASTLTRGTLMPVARTRAWSCARFSALARANSATTPACAVTPRTAFPNSRLPGHMGEIVRRGSFQQGASFLAGGGHHARPVQGVSASASSTSSSFSRRPCTVSLKRRRSSARTSLIAPLGSAKLPLGPVCPGPRGRVTPPTGPQRAPKAAGGFASPFRPRRAAGSSKATRTVPSRPRADRRSTSAFGKCARYALNAPLPTSRGELNLAERTPDETLHFARRAQQVAPSPPFWRDLLRLDRVLRNEPSNASRPPRRLASGLHRRDIGPEIEGQLPMRMCSLSQQDCVQERAGDRSALLRQWHGDARRRRIASALRRMTSRTAPSIALSEEYSSAERTSGARCPNRSTRPSRC